VRPTEGSPRGTSVHLTTIPSDLCVLPKLLNRGDLRKVSSRINDGNATQQAEVVRSRGLKQIASVHPLNLHKDRDQKCRGFR